MTSTMASDAILIIEPHLPALVKRRDLEGLRSLGGFQEIPNYLESHPIDGINGEAQDLSRRRDLYGSNTYQRPPSKGLLYFVLEAVKDSIILIFMTCAVPPAAFGIHDEAFKECWYDGGSIFIAICLTVLIESITNFRQARQFDDKLSEESDNIEILVIRSGQKLTISISQVLVGEVVCLKKGDKVPADGLLLSGRFLQVDESSITGESDHVNVDMSSNPFLFFGAMVADGSGKMLVTSVGLNTKWGEKMSSITHNTKEDDEVQTRLNKLASYVMMIGLAVAAMVLIVLLSRYFSSTTKDHSGNREFVAGKTKFSEVVKAVARIIIVVAIPKGLPLAVTLKLAPSMKRMMAADMTIISWGRCVFNNIQKFIQFQLTVNVAFLTINFVSAISSGDVPLTTVQLLWLNLITGTLGALALATERPTEELMENISVGRTVPLITNVMWRNLLAQAVYQIAVLLVLQFKGGFIFGVDEKMKNTLIFNTFVLCQVFNEFNARRLEKKNVFEGIFKNKLFVGIVGIKVVLQVLMVEFLKKFSDTERLDWGQWGICIAMAALSWPLGWLVKCIQVSDKPLFGL